MSKSFLPTAAKPGVITANDLRDGYNLWMTVNGWSRDPADAVIFDDEAIAELALLDAIGQFDRVVGPYLVETRRGPNGPEPAHFRETFRQTGPSNHFHGIQAEKAVKSEAGHV